MASIRERDSSWREKAKSKGSMARSMGSDLMESRMLRESREARDSQDSREFRGTKGSSTLHELPRRSRGSSAMSTGRPSRRQSSGRESQSPVAAAPESRAAIVAPLEEARFAATLLRAAGASTAHARLVASALAAADVRGKIKHGLLLLPEILNDVSNGAIDPRATPALVNDAAALAWVDGGVAFGPVVGHYCMSLALYKAQVLGLGVVFCRSNSDIGYPGWYSSMALKKNMIGLCFSSFHEQPVSMTSAAAGNTNLALNRISASAPCSDANNFELQLSWRLALPPQTLAPRLPAELRRATSSELILQEDSRPPPGACGHDPRKGFLAALAVEGLCGFVGGLHYEAHLRSSLSTMQPFRTFDSGSYGESKDASPSDGSSPRRSHLVSILNRKKQGQVRGESTESSPTGSGESSDSPTNKAGTGGDPLLTEIACSKTPPSDVSQIDECACVEGQPPRVITPSPHRPPEATVRCLPNDVEGKRGREEPKRVTMDIDDTSFSDPTSASPQTQTLPSDEMGESPKSDEDDRSPMNKSPSFLEKEPRYAEENFPEDDTADEVSPESPEEQGPSVTDHVEDAQSAHCFIAVDPEAIEPGFPLRLGGFMRHMTSQEPLDPARPVMVPGDPERMSILRAQRQGGVRFYIDDVHRLNVLAERLGVAPLQYRPDVEYAWWRET